MIRRYKSRINGNPIIYVNAGDSVNISCLFDPNLIMINYNDGRAGGFQAFAESKSSPPSGFDDEDDLAGSFSSAGAVVPSSMFSNYNFDQFRRKRKIKKRHFNPDSSAASSPNRKNKNHHGRGHGTFIPTDQSTDANNNNLFQASLKSKPSDEPNIKSEQDDETLSVTSSQKQQEFPSLGKYELDWYFLDKNGHMNIIRYAQQTLWDEINAFKVEN